MAKNHRYEELVGGRLGDPLKLPTIPLFQRQQKLPGTEHEVERQRINGLD